MKKKYSTPSLSVYKMEMTEMLMMSPVPQNDANYLNSNGGSFRISYDETVEEEDAGGAM